MYLRKTTSGARACRLRGESNELRREVIAALGGVDPFSIRPIFKKPTTALAVHVPTPRPSTGTLRSTGWRRP